MKKIILPSLLLMFFCLQSSFSQQPAEYKSLDSFKRDTLKFVLYNFEQNKEMYIGQVFEKFWTDYGLPMHIYEREYQSQSSKKDGKLYFITFLYYSMEDFEWLSKDPRPHASIKITFTSDNYCAENPFYNERRPLRSEPDGNIIAKRIAGLKIADIQTEIFWSEEE
ncbi:hypothetical protein LJC45_01075 [Alistipes sp. OttesenSCG-928-B03]|nr:hypothetical protein [Alistipes sp. OttesenSCG-928-B03]